MDKEAQQRLEVLQGYCERSPAHVINYLLRRWTQGELNERQWLWLHYAQFQQLSAYRLTLDDL